MRGLNGQPVLVIGSPKDENDFQERSQQAFVPQVQLILKMMKTHGLKTPLFRNFFYDASAVRDRVEALRNSTAWISLLPLSTLERQINHDLPEKSFLYLFFPVFTYDKPETR